MESSISSSDSSPRNLHFVVIPWLAPGHMIPMLDIACLLARRGATISLITTPANLSRVHNAAELPVRFVPLPFPSVEFGLPPGCENLDSLPSRSLAPNFYNASKTLKEPLIHHLLAPNTPPPACILGDSAHVWAADVARQLRVQTLVFRGYGCFATLCIKNIMLHRTHETVSANTDLFVIPGLPQRIEITRAQLPRELQSSVQHPEIIKEVSESDARADGIVINSFDELEAGYGELLEKATAKKVFMIGPASSHQRSNGGNEAECKAWLDSMRPRSVIYVCFGSMSPFGPRQLTELGHGLLASGRPFIWVIKSVPNAEFEHWLQENFCDESRCLIIRRWAPQAMILSRMAGGIRGWAPQAMILGGS